MKQSMWMALHIIIVLVGVQLVHGGVQLVQHSDGGVQLVHGGNGGGNLDNINADDRHLKDLNCSTDDRVGDGLCDPVSDPENRDGNALNVEECDYDGGDCCKETCQEGSTWKCNVGPITNPSQCKDLVVRAARGKCSEGIMAGDPPVCCHPLCPVCGGEDCGAMMSPHWCCITAIRDNGENCNDTAKRGPCHNPIVG